jgi:hypothetical protein
MKKPSSLSEQVKQAQKVVSGWSESQRRDVSLQGTDTFLMRHSRQSHTPAQASIRTPHVSKAKVAA